MPTIACWCGHSIDLSIRSRHDSRSDAKSNACSKSNRGTLIPWPPKENFMFFSGNSTRELSVSRDGARANRVRSRPAGRPIVHVAIATLSLVSAVMCSHASAADYIKDNAAVFSPDAKQVFIGHGAGDPTLWDVASGKKIRSFSCDDGPDGGPSRTCAVAFSPNGKAVLAAYRFTAALWNAATGKLIHRMSIHSTVKEYSPFEQEPRALGFSPDGKLIWAAGWNFGTVKMWSAATGEETDSIETSLVKDDPNNFLITSAARSSDRAQAGSGKHQCYLRLGCCEG